MKEKIYSINNRLLPREGFEFENLRVRGSFLALIYRSVPSGRHLIVYLNEQGREVLTQEFSDSLGCRLVDWLYQKFFKDE